MSMNLPDLVRGLESFGVTVPNVDAWRALERLPLHGDEAIRPGLIGLTTDELAAETHRVTLARVLNDPQRGRYASAVRDVTAAASLEFAAILATHADALIVGLRAAFDPAADAARHLVGLGVSPAATVETLFDAPDHVRRAWREFTTVHTRTLERVFALRQALTKHLGIPPVDRSGSAFGLAAGETQWGLAVTRPAATGKHGAGVFRPDPGGPHVRWLELAHLLYLPTVAELMPSAVAHAEGLPVDLLLREARRRAALGLAEDETTDSPTATVDLADEYLARLADTTTADTAGDPTA